MSMTTEFMSPGIASAGAIPAINAKDSTINVAGGNQTNNTTIYNVDPNCNQGIWTHQFCKLRLIIGSDKIYQWLSAVIPSTNYHGALRAHLEDTGLWFMNGSRFARWKAQADDFLWIYGPRMYSYHLRVIIHTELLWQLVPERLS
jgi:hypothetical protein